MTPLTRWATQLVLALVLGGVAGWGAVALLTEHRQSQIDAQQERAVDLRGLDRYDAVLDALGDDGVYVADDGRYLLDAAGEQAVEQAVAASPERVFVVVWADQQEIGARQNDVTEQLEAALGPERGVLYLWQGPGTGDVRIVGEEGGGSIPGFSSSVDLVGEAAVTLPTAVEAVADTDWYGTADNDYYGGVGGGAVLGVFLATGAAPALILVAWTVARLRGAARLPGRWSWKEDRG